MASGVTLPGLIAAAVFAGWGALCVWNQFRGGLRRRLPWVHLGRPSARWELFTGVPPRIVLWCRERGASGETGAWRRVALRAPSSVLHLVWFGSMGGGRAFASLRWLCQPAARRAEERGTEARHVAQVHRLVALGGAPGTSRQFRITALSDPSRVLYESPFATP